MLAQLIAQLPTHSSVVHRFSLNMDLCVGLAGTNQQLAEAEQEFQSHPTCM